MKHGILKLKADAITAERMAYESVSVITMFNADAATRELAYGLRFGDTCNGIELHDKFDNGCLDVHESGPEERTFLKLIGNDNRKTNPVILVFALL